jgi:hypothetical protein
VTNPFGIFKLFFYLHSLCYFNKSFAYASYANAYYEVDGGLLCHFSPSAISLLSLIPLSG